MPVTPRTKSVMITNIMRRHPVSAARHVRPLASSNKRINISSRSFATSSATAPQVGSVAQQQSKDNFVASDSGRRQAESAAGDVHILSKLRITPYPEIKKIQHSAASVPVWDGQNLHFKGPNSEHYELVSKRWLRDQCPCEKCVHPETRQRQMDSFQINPNIAIRSYSQPSGESAAKIEWDDGHESVYPINLLRKTKPKHLDYARRGFSNRKLWDSEAVRGSPPSVAYDSIMKGKGLAEWTQQINEFGFSFVKGCPIDGQATKELLAKIGPIRETHYGGFYDFTSNMASKDTAYTTLSLGAHTDTTYFSEPAGLQMFHMLSHTGGSGGESLLVDGFAAANQLYHEDREAYRILSTIRVWSHASGNEDVSIQPYTCFPVLGHDPVLGHLMMVRWNNDDRAGIDAEGEMVDKWYDAASKFNSILNSAKYQYWTQLEPGVPLIFDNWRVLHGRSQFTGKRRMSGGYINRDDFISRYKLSNFTREQVLEATVTG